MFNREFFDTYLPKGEQLDAKVKQCLVECFKVELPCPDKDLAWLLTTMATFLEDEWRRWLRHEESWKSPQNPDFEHDLQSWVISFRGLDYKNKSQYLTAEGWPCGTTCWFVTIEYGWREHATAEEPLLAVQRAIIMLCACVRASKTQPSKRRNVMEIVKQIMQEQ